MATKKMSRTFSSHNMEIISPQIGCDSIMVDLDQRNLIFREALSRLFINKKMSLKPYKMKENTLRQMEA